MICISLLSGKDSPPEAILAGCSLRRTHKMSHSDRAGFLNCEAVWRTASYFLVNSVRQFGSNRGVNPAMATLGLEPGLAACVSELTAPSEGTFPLGRYECLSDHKMPQPVNPINNAGLMLD